MSMSDRVQIEQALCFNLYAASRLMGQAYVKPLKAINLTYLQFLVMNLLWNEDHVTLKKLGERLYLDSGTLTPLINRLVKQKLIAKKKSKRDGREIFIVLTKQGHELEKKAAHVPMQMFCKLSVSVDKFEVIRDGVREILKNLEKSVELDKLET